MPYIYHPSRMIYYSPTHFVLFYHHYYLLLIITVYFILFFFSPPSSLLMANSNAMYHPSFIIYYSSTRYLFTYYFLINPLFPPWMVNANFIFILVFVSSYFCFILRMRHGLFFILVFLSYFIYNVLPLLYTFSSCSPHIVNTFYLVFFFLAHGIWLISHNVVNTRPQSRTHRHVHTPSTADAFSGHQY